MNSFKIINLNLKNNAKKHVLYVISMIFAVSTYYNFWNLFFNPQVSETKDLSMYVRAVGTLTIFFMIVFFIFFIVYSSNFFLNEKKKEIGLYSLMGIDNKKLAFIFASEELFLGLISIIAGLVMGILFSKLFMMILAHVALLNIVFNFSISKEEIYITIGTFGLIFIIAFLIGYIKITKMTLINLLYSNKTYEKAPKVKYFSGIFSIIILIIAYIVAIFYTSIGFTTSLNLAVLLVIIGTTLFFRSFFTITISKIIKNKKILYKNTKIISYSNIFFRIKDNYKTLSAICILITATITSLATVVSIKYYVANNYTIESPFTISYISDDSKMIDDVNNIVKKSKAEVLSTNKYKLIQKDEYNIISYSTFEKILKDLNVKNKNKILSKDKLNNNSLIYINPPEQMGSIINSEDLKFENKNYEIIDTLRVPTFGLLLNHATIVLDNNEYNKIKANIPEIQFNGIILSETNAKDKAKEISSNLDINSNAETKITAELFNKYPKARIYTSLMNDLNNYNLAGIVFFLGSFMCLVFILATGSILYFKIIGEALKEKMRFKIIKNIGTTEHEIRKTVKDQVKLYYIAPFILAIVHSSFAIYVLSHLMKYKLYIPMILSIIMASVIIYIYYKMTVKKYINIIK